MIEDVGSEFREGTLFHLEQWFRLGRLLIHYRSWRY